MNGSSAWSLRLEPLPEPEPQRLRLMAEWAMHRDDASPIARQTTFEFFDGYFSMAVRNGWREALGPCVLVVVLALVLIAVAVAIA